MIIYYDNNFNTIKFGVEILKKSIQKKGIFHVEKRLNYFVGSRSDEVIVASFMNQGIKKDIQGLEEGGFNISIDGNTVYVTGKDHTGTMYGLMDIAETIELYGVSAIKEKQENPFLKMRGIKFNLPFEPYDNGDPFEKNIKTCLDINFWREFIDFLAVNRYNCLSLWSEHPFHMMFRLEKYPDTCPYSDVELETYKQLYKFIFSHARSRGINVYLITWNIRITPFVAKGLGLPQELGDMFDRYDLIHDKYQNIPNNVRDFDPVRQHLDLIKDYFKECIKTLVTTYRDLSGLGTNCAEEMVGDAVERQNWVMETYLEAVKETGRDIPFIMRSNQGNGMIAKQFLDKYPSKEVFISWKYSNAHMYSSTEPQFEKLWGAWDGMDFENVKIIYTVRNDDFHTFRWGDCDYIKDYVRKMKKPNVYGYYWGADGYIWADDFQHVPHIHKHWKYDFERNWHQFELLGRLGYNPELPDEIWVEKYKARYSKNWGGRIYHAMKAASKVVPAVNRLFWINYDYEWHAESLLTIFGFKTVRDFVNGKAMPGIGTLSIREFVENKLKGIEGEWETPEDIIRIIGEAAVEVDKILSELKKEIPKLYMCDDLVCTLSDIEAWGQLGKYYCNKFTAALKLAFYEKTGKVQDKEEAIACLEKALKDWKILAQIWSSHYMPYKMVRSKYIFGYSYYLDDVEKDIELARNFQQNSIERVKLI